MEELPVVKPSIEIDKNEVTLLGSLVRDPEPRYTGKGKLVCNFSLCVLRGPLKTFVACTCWEEIAERVACLKARQRVYIRGRIQTRIWEKNGEKRTSTEVICDQILAKNGGVQ